VLASHSAKGLFVDAEERDEVLVVETVFMREEEAS
jgi:hypothetical protein